MKLVIIKNIFLVLFIICAITTIFSFTHDNHNLLDSAVTGLAAITYLLSFLIFHKQISEKENRKEFLSNGFIRIFYIITIILFFAAVMLAFLHGQSSLSLSSLTMCAIAQVAGYLAFIKQSKSKTEDIG